MARLGCSGIWGSSRFGTSDLATLLINRTLGPLLYVAKPDIFHLMSEGGKLSIYTIARVLPKTLESHWLTPARYYPKILSLIARCYIGKNYPELQWSPIYTSNNVQQAAVKLVERTNCIHRRL